MGAVFSQKFFSCLLLLFFVRYNLSHPFYFVFLSSKFLILGMCFEYILVGKRRSIGSGYQGFVDVLYVYVTRIAKLGWGLRREAVLPQVEQIVLGRPNFIHNTSCFSYINFN